MYDDNYDRSVRGAGQISAQELYDVSYWLEALSMPKEQLAVLVDNAGDCEEAVRECLRFAKALRND